MPVELLFYTGSNESLAKEIIKKSKGLKKGKCLITHYQDGEILVHINEKVKGKKVFVVGATFSPAENALELIILINTLKENGAKEIVAIIPYFGYGKQDRIKYPGDAMSAKLMAKIIEDAGASKIIALDLHSRLVEKHFHKPIKHLSAVPLLAKYFQSHYLKNKTTIKDWVVVAPDLGGVKRAREFAAVAGIKNITEIKKIRQRVDECQIIGMTGEINARNAVIVDDMTQTGGTLIAAATALKKHGAKKVIVMLTHLVHTGPAISNLRRDKFIDQIIFTDTTGYAKGIQKNKKFVMLSSAELFLNNI